MARPPAQRRLYVQITHEQLEALIARAVAAALGPYMAELAQRDDQIARANQTLAARVSGDHVAVTVLAASVDRLVAQRSASSAETPA